ncbi:hypothetical protein ebA15 [Aromatoleum aromaticum EbN1]|uniref:Uncharacterized protein n=1 Tax=Aromatoleum aromaticum (strain DSM 19018 / LMG 30748 / EbN1) TaxID=76114 RepID=Q5P980_AROAE|nr:hypothetical protein [Aromatoleum aromaticum]CAI06129.1 hypothetical protein ebA15 [Aromatoleum aromaticum EbN1]
MSAPKTRFRRPSAAPASLRDEIVDVLTRDGEATAKHIAWQTNAANFPSRVANELNKMLADALVECEKRKGRGNEYFYWLVTASPATGAAEHGTRPQPEVGQNTGSDGEEVNLSSPAVAVPEPAPAAPATPAAAPVAEDVSDSDLEVQYLSPEDYEMPPANPSLLASANRMMSQALDAWRDLANRNGCTTPEGLGAHITDTEQRLRMALDVAAVVKADWEAIHEALGRDDIEIEPNDIVGAIGELRETLRLLSREATRLRESTAAAIAERDNATALADKLQHLLDSSRHETEALRAEVERLRASTTATVESFEPAAAADVLDTARGYLLRVPKRPARILTQPHSARAAAIAAARNGAARAEVFALVHVGTARPAAEWGEA